jgi:signal transduction histidine kinase
MEKPEFEPRSKRRRQGDVFMHEQVRRLQMVAEVGQLITSILELDKLLDLIVEQTGKILNTERGTVFLHDKKKNMLWSFVGTGINKNTISIASGEGIAGWVFQNRRAIIINDPYNDDRFCTDVDKRSGFVTRNILSMPILNRTGVCLGVVQTLNKESGFDVHDQEILKSLTNYIAIAIENARLYDELKSLDKAKERIINHLSHELKTPLTILLSVLGRVAKKAEEAGIDGLGQTIERGQRNVNRLLDLQKKIQDIMQQKQVHEKEQIHTLIESALSIVGELADGSRDSGQSAAVLDRVADFLDALFPCQQQHIEQIALEPFLEDICRDAEALMCGRAVGITRQVDAGITMNMDRSVLEKICSGLLKNAIEHTPDETAVRVTAGCADGGVLIAFEDHGIGISEENRKNIFTGFFHALDTDMYSSKSPYQFYAGGSGADLLRLKVFSERFGFQVKLDSVRCRHLPHDSDLCPGKVSACSFVPSLSGCSEAGGSVFSLFFPAQGAA